MDKPTVVLILFLLGILLFTILPVFTRRQRKRDRDPEFDSEKKPPKVVPIVVPVYPSGQYPRTVYVKKTIVQASPEPINVPRSADVSLSQKSV